MTRKIIIPLTDVTPAQYEKLMRTLEEIGVNHLYVPVDDRISNAKLHDINDGQSYGVQG